MKFNSKGRLAEVWDTPVAGTPLFVPHKAILDSAQRTLYVADRENMRVLSFSTAEGGRGRVFSNQVELGGRPYAVFFNGSSNSSDSDWPMYGVFGGRAGAIPVGFTLDKYGKKVDTWGPKEVGTIKSSQSRRCFSSILSFLSQ